MGVDVRVADSQELLEDAVKAGVQFDGRFLHDLEEDIQTGADVLQVFGHEGLFSDVLATNGEEPVDAFKHSALVGGLLLGQSFGGAVRLEKSVAEEVGDFDDELGGVRGLGDENVEEVD